MRIETKHLFRECVSPYTKSCILKKRAGIPLNEHEENRLKTFRESVSMVMPSKYHDRTSPTGRLLQTFGKQKPIGDEEEEIDLDEILRELGYEDDDMDVKVPIGDDETFEIDVEDEDELREYIRNIVRENFKEELENHEYEEGIVGEVPDFEEIIIELDNIEDNDLEEGLTYDVEYASYGYGGKKYHRIRRTFNNDNHFSNWYKWMSKQGLKIIGVHPIK